MKKIEILLFAVLFILLACKKNNSTTSTGGGYTASQNTSISNGFPASGTGSINGVLYAQHISVPSYSISQYYGGATFSKTAKPFSSLYALLGILLPGEQAGVLKLDSTVLKYNYTSAQNNINTYSDTTNTSVYSSLKWNIGGNANFTAFITNVQRGYPIITNTNYLPTTFSKSQPLTINFGSNYSNTDSIIVAITDNASPTSFFIYKYIAGNVSSVTFTASQLSGASTSTTNPQIIIYAKNYSNITNGNKNYIFVMENDLTQFVTITP